MSAFFQRWKENNNKFSFTKKSTKNLSGLFGRNLMEQPNKFVWLKFSLLSIYEKNGHQIFIESKTNKERQTTVCVNSLIQNQAMQLTDSNKMIVIFCCQPI